MPSEAVSFGSEEHSKPNSFKLFFEWPLTILESFSLNDMRNDEALIDKMYGHLVNYKLF